MPQVISCERKRKVTPDRCELLDEELQAVRKPAGLLADEM